MQLKDLFSDPKLPIRKINIINPIDQTPFNPQKHYFQIGVVQVYIKKLEAFLKEFSPLVYSNLQYQVGSRRIESTYLIDPRKDKAGSAGKLLLGYQPIITPTPFINNDIELTIALLRLQVADYIPAAVNLLTSVASVVLPDFKISDQIAKTLNNGVNDLIKDSNSFVVGWKGSSSTGDPLTPGYTVLTNNPSIDVENLFILNNTLMTGDEPETAIPFDTADFLMFRVDKLEFRDDYLTVEPIATLYEKALDAIRENRADTLTEIHSVLRRAVMTAAQFTFADAKRITTELTNEMKERWEAQAQPGLFKKDEIRITTKQPTSVTDAEFEAAMAWAPNKHGG